MVYAIEVVQKGSRKPKAGECRLGFVAYGSAKQLKSYPSQVFANYQRAKAEAEFLAGSQVYAQLKCQVAALQEEDLFALCPPQKEADFRGLVEKWKAIGKLAV